MLLQSSVPGMDMSEKMGFEIRKGWKPFKDFFRAIVDAVIEIKDSIGRRTGDKNVGIFGDMCIVAALAVCYAISHEHRDPVESQTLNLDAGIAEIMHIVVKTVDIGSIQAVIVVAADEYLVAIGQVAEPVEEINGFLLGSNHTEVAGMHHHIGLGQIPKPMMAVVRVRKMEYFHILKVSALDMGRRKSSEQWYLKMYL